MASLKEKLDYLNAIAKERTLSRSDYEAASALLYGKPNPKLYPCRSVFNSQPPNPNPQPPTPRQNYAPPSRFTRGECEVLRELYKSENVRYSDLGQWLGVCKSTICHVIAGKGAYKNFARDY